MDTTSSQRPNGRDGVLSRLNAAIYDLNLAKETTGIVPAKNTFDFASALLTRIRVCISPVCVGSPLADTHTQESMIKDNAYVELGLACANVCLVLNRGTSGRHEVSQSVFGAIERLAA